MIGGIAAPPTIAMQSKPDTAGVGAFERASVSVKMVGNMMELKKPTASAAAPPAAPADCATKRQRPNAVAAAMLSSRPALILVSSQLPTKRPTMAPPQ